MNRIGITGGIGSGKSYVSRWLEGRGILVYDADREAKRLMLSNEEIRCGLVAILGRTVYDGDALNKSLLASYVFSNADCAARVNALVHPWVKADFIDWAGRHQGLVALESAILYEAGFEDAVDAVVMIHAPVTLRLRRVMVRDGCSEEQVRARMAMQADEEGKCRRADFVVENDGIQSLFPQLEKMLERFRAGNFT